MGCRRHHRVLAAVALAFVITLGWRAEAEAPPPKPSPPSASLSEHHPDPSWYSDPRWWAIIATFCMSAGGLISQALFRSSDRREDLAGEQFDTEVREAIRESYKELRSLGQTVRRACEIQAPAERTDALKKIREVDACEAFSLFSMALQEADVRLSLQGVFTDINADLEDGFYPVILQASTAGSSPELRQLSVKISNKIVHAISACDDLLRQKRARYISRKECKRRAKNEKRELSRAGSEAARTN